MDKTRATQVPVPGDLDTTINYLIQCRNEGKNVFVDFQNQYRLYSSDVTFENAYIMIVGMTKEEIDTMDQRMRAATTREEKDRIIAEYDAIVENRRNQQKKAQAVNSMDKTRATQVPIPGDLDKTINYLIQCRNEGKNVFVDFYGNKLYSSDVTVNNAYMMIFGMTKEERDAIDTAMRNATTREEKDRIIAYYNERMEAHKKRQEQTNSEVVYPNDNVVIDGISFKLINMDIVINYLKNRGIHDVFEERNGVYIMKSVDLNTRYEILNACSSYLCAVLGEIVLGTDAMPEWNTGVGRRVNERSPLIKFLYKKGDIEKANKVLLDMIEDLSKFDHEVLQGYSQGTGEKEDTGKKI